MKFLKITNKTLDDIIFNQLKGKFTHNLETTPDIHYFLTKNIKFITHGLLIMYVLIVGCAYITVVLRLAKNLRIMLAKCEPSNTTLRNFIMYMNMDITISIIMDIFQPKVLGILHEPKTNDSYKRKECNSPKPH